MIQKAESNVGVTVFFEETITEDEMLEVQKLIDSREEVSSTTYISAEEAWEDFKKDYFPDGDTGILSGLDQDNPLADCASVQVYLADTSRQNELVDYIKTLNGVSEVNASQIIADSFTNFSRLIGYISMAVILILVFVAIFLISNTVMIGITVRKEEIAIMKYIGATDAFVRAPFVLEGMVLGVIGAAIPLAALYFLYNTAVEFILTKFNVLTGVVDFIPVWQIYQVLLPIGLLLGIGIGFIGSIWTTRKHLRV